jgi:hypothetical protein
MFTFLASAICVFIYEKTFLGTNEKYAYGGGFVKKLLGSVLIFLTLLLCEPGMLLSGFLINTGLVESLDSIISTDYGFLGALLPFLIYLAKTKNKQMAIILLTTCLIYFPINTNSGSLSINPVDILLIAAANVSLFFIYFYNNKRGTGPKYLFYIYYPLHLLVFSLIYIFI